MFARCRMVGLIAVVFLSGSVGRAEDAQEPMQVSVEVKLVEITANVFQELKARGLVDARDKDSHAPKAVTFLNDARTFRLMETVQNDIHTNVMQAPKMTMFDGQAAALKTADYQKYVTGLEIVHCDDHIEYRPKTETVPLGLQIRLRSVLGADRRAVRVHLGATLTNAAEETPPFSITTPAPDKANGPDGKPQTVTHYIDQPHITKLNVDRTLDIPDGHTAVLTGGKMVCAVNKSVGPEVLSRIPYLGQLFRKTEHETHHLLFLVTPRILVTPEEEEKRPRAMPPDRLQLPGEE